MAVTSEIKSLSVNFTSDLGAGTDGETIYASKTLSDINGDCTDDQLYSCVEAAQELYAGTLYKVKKVTTELLTKNV